MRRVLMELRWAPGARRKAVTELSVERTVLEEARRQMAATLHPPEAQAAWPQARRRAALPQVALAQAV